MKSYSVKQLYKELSKALKELPFEITHYKKPIAVVVDADEYERAMNHKLSSFRGDAKPTYVVGYEPFIDNGLFKSERPDLNLGKAFEDIREEK
jgi:hypothetical protein